MKDPGEYIASGVLEMYVLGLTTTEESQEVERMAAEFPEVKEEINEIRMSVDTYSDAKFSAPHPAVKTLLLATIDFMERLQNGEQPSAPPELNENSRVEDFSEWLNRSDMVLAEDADDIYAKILGHTPEMTTVIAWIKDFVPDEVHDDQFEKFLIVEGSCEIITEKETYKLKAGDYFAVPLHCTHKLKVTSSGRCKAILQRVAA
jgi:mannose-6-phosphate isomerase-like protein (cupin superfamily)